MKNCAGLCVHHKLNVLVVVWVKGSAAFSGEEDSKPWLFGLHAVDTSPNDVLRRADLWLRAELAEWVARPELGAWQRTQIDAIKCRLKSLNVPECA